MSLGAAVNLIDDILRGICLPLPTSLLDSIWNMHALHLLRIGYKRREETARGVPGDVAVEGPDAGLGVELEDEMAIRADELDIAALRVGGSHDGAIPGAEAFVEDVEVVAVEMHGVARGNTIVRT